MMEIIRAKPSPTPVKAVMLDFDGTISTLRHGWEKIMAPLMIRHLGPQSAEMVRDYIDLSTGIQTIHQMKWLAQHVQQRCGSALDPWEYKEEYNSLLMVSVEKNLKELERGTFSPESFLVAGARPFLEKLKELGIAVHVASGTDDPDVKHEARALGLSHLINSIHGAPLLQEACSKEKVMRDLAAYEGFGGDEVCVIGDGKVEISLGRELGARCLGIASNEETRSGINPAKRERLLCAGAEAITGDFLQLDAILAWMNLEGERIDDLP